MDKEETTEIIQYKYENNVVTVERHFGNMQIKDILKNIIDNQRQTVFTDLAKEDKCVRPCTDKR